MQNRQLVNAWWPKLSPSSNIGLVFQTIAHFLQIYVSSPCCLVYPLWCQSSLLSSWPKAKGKGFDQNRWFRVGQTAQCVRRLARSWKGWEVKSYPSRCILKPSSSNDRDECACKRGAMAQFTNLNFLWTNEAVKVRGGGRLRILVVHCCLKKC